MELFKILKKKKIHVETLEGRRVCLICFLLLTAELDYTLLLRISFKMDLLDILRIFSLDAGFTKKKKIEHFDLFNA